MKILKADKLTPKDYIQAGMFLAAMKNTFPIKRRRKRRTKKILSK